MICHDKEMQKLNSFIEHTLLKPEAQQEDFRKLCLEAKQNLFLGVCVNSSWTEFCRREIDHLFQDQQNSKTKLVTVVGFPSGVGLSRAKAFETEQSIALGADEIDMVIHLGWLKDRRIVEVENDIKSVVAAAQGRPVKVIFETHLLTQEEKILACEICIRAGAHFVKTSTGFSGGGATAEDVLLMKQIVGDQLGVKASGGVRSLEQAEKMIEAGASRLGTSSGVAIVQGKSIGSGY